jgi:hypothetical protein
MSTLEISTVEVDPIDAGETEARVELPGDHSNVGSPTRSRSSSVVSAEDVPMAKEDVEDVETAGGVSDNIHRSITKLTLVEVEDHRAFMYEQVKARIRDLEGQLGDTKDTLQRVRQERKAAQDECKSAKRERDELRTLYNRAIVERNEGFGERDAAKQEADVLRSCMAVLESRSRDKAVVGNKRTRLDSSTSTVEQAQAASSKSPRINGPGGGNHGADAPSVEREYIYPAFVPGNRATYRSRVPHENKPSTTSSSISRMQTGEPLRRVSHIHTQRVRQPEVSNMDPSAHIRYLVSLDDQERNRLGVMRDESGRFMFGTVRFYLLSRSIVDHEITSRVACARAIIQAGEYRKYGEPQNEPKSMVFDRRAFPWNVDLYDVFDHLIAGGVTAEEMEDAGAGAMRFLQARVLQDNGRHIPDYVREIVEREVMGMSEYVWKQQNSDWMSQRAKTAVARSRKSGGNTRNAQSGCVPVTDEDWDMRA